MTERQIIRQLLKDFEALKKENFRLVLRVAELEDRLSKYENPKNSKNSSVPPSQHPNRVTRSLRNKSNRKVGGLLPESKSAEEMAICNTQELVIKNTQLCFKSTNFFGF